MLLVFRLHLAAYHSVTMPALLLRSAQQSTQRKSQNDQKAIFEVTINTLGGYNKNVIIPYCLYDVVLFLCCHRYV